MRSLATRRSSSLSSALLILAGCLFAALLPGVQAQDALNRPRMLYGSSASYCSPPEVLLVNTVNLTLFPDNQTLTIALSAGSVENDVDVTVGVEVIAYTRSLLSFSLDLCTIVGGILCPLPTYQFTGGGTYPIPDGILDGVPSIAYSVPDLEALARLTLTSSTGEEVGCIQVTLSNGHTMEQAPAKWATVGLVLLALFSSLLHSVIAQSVGAAQWRVVDVFMTVQHIAITALLSVNFPSVFVSFALNFAWSIGLVDIPSLQNSIESTRSSTGGNTAALLGESLEAQIARDQSVWLTEEGSQSSPASSLSLGFFRNMLSQWVGNAGQTAPVRQTTLAPLSANVSHFAPLSSYPPAYYWKRAAMYAPNTGPGGETVTQTSTGTLPLISNSSTTAEGGLIILSQRANVPAQNAFLTILVSIFILVGIILAAIGVTLIIVLLFRLCAGRRDNSLAHWSRRVMRPSEVGYLVAAFMGRTLLVTFPVLCIFAFYQWRFGDSWVPDFLAALFMLFFLVAIVVFFAPLFKHAFRGSSSSLYYGDTPPVLSSRATKRWGHMAHPFRPRFFWFSLAFLFMNVARACFIGFAQGHDFAQSVGLLVIEVVFLLVLCVFRVGRDKKSDAVFIVLGVFRVLTWAVCIALTERAGLTWIPRVIVGFVVVVVTGLPVIYVFIFLVVIDLFSPFRRSKLRGKRSGYDEGEKAMGMGMGQKDQMVGTSENPSLPPMTSTYDHSTADQPTQEMLERSSSPSGASSLVAGVVPGRGSANLHDDSADAVDSGLGMEQGGGGGGSTMMETESGQQPVFGQAR